MCVPQRTWSLRTLSPSTRCRPRSRPELAPPGGVGGCCPPPQHDADTVLVESSLGSEDNDSVREGEEHLVTHGIGGWTWGTEAQYTDTQYTDTHTHSDAHIYIDTESHTQTQTDTQVNGRRPLVPEGRHRCPLIHLRHAPTPPPPPPDAHPPPPPPRAPPPPPPPP